MAFKFVIFASALAVASAAPFTITANNYYPNGIAFETPSIAYGFGSGFASKFGGIEYASGIGSSFQTGDASAHGSGYAGNTEKTYAGGVGSANTHGNNVIYYQYPSTSYQTPTVWNNDRPGYAVSSAQNNGGNGAAIAHSQTGSDYGTAFSAAQNLGGGSSFSRADNLGSNNIATAHTLGQGISISAAHNFGDQGLNSAQAVSSGGQSSAITYNAHDHQFAQSHAYGR